MAEAFQVDHHQVEEAEVAGHHQEPEVAGEAVRQVLVLVGLQECLES